MGTVGLKYPIYGCLDPLGQYPFRLGGVDAFLRGHRLSFARHTRRLHVVACRYIGLKRVTIMPLGVYVYTIELWESKGNLQKF